MRVAQICPYAWSAHGGVQAHVRHLSRHLVARGHEVLVLAPDDAGGQPGVGAPACAPACASGSRPRLRLVGPCVRVRFNGSVVPICVRPSAFRVLRRALHEFQPDVVHVHEPLAPMLSLLASWRLGAPLVGTFHAHYPLSIDALLYGAAMRCVRPVSRRLSMRLAVSRAAAESVAPLGGVPLRIVPNGVDVASFASAQPRPLPPGRRLLTVSRLEPRKGFTVLLSAFDRLAAEADDLWLIVVGSGPCRAAVDSLPARTRARVVMLGNLPDDEVPAVYRAANAFVAPAIGGESFGLVLLEAMASGLAIAGSDIPGYREVARPGREALLVPPGDAGALAAAARQLLNDPSVAGRLAAAGRERVREFAWEGVCADVERAYHDVLGRPGALPATEVVAVAGSTP